jgi:hypothetical protein
MDKNVIALLRGVELPILVAGVEVEQIALAEMAALA